MKTEFDEKTKKMMERWGYTKEYLMKEFYKEKDNGWYGRKMVLKGVREE
jgi:hypothetical protein